MNKLLISSLVDYEEDRKLMKTMSKLKGSDDSPQGIWFYYPDTDCSNRNMIRALNTEKQNG